MGGGYFSQRNLVNTKLNVDIKNELDGVNLSQLSEKYVQMYSTLLKHEIGRSISPQQQHEHILTYSDAGNGFKISLVIEKETLNILCFLLGQETNILL